MRLLHLRLAHFSRKKIRESIAAGARFGTHDLNDADKNDAEEHSCAGCLKGLSKAIPKQRNPERAKQKGDLVHADLKEKVDKAYSGHEHWVHFTDDKTGQTYLHLSHFRSFCCRCCCCCCAFVLVTYLLSLRLLACGVEKVRRGVEGEAEEGAWIEKKWRVNSDRPCRR